MKSVSNFGGISFLYFILESSQEEKKGEGFNVHAALKKLYTTEE
jgi:hypothetical protein